MRDAERLTGHARSALTDIYSDEQGVLLVRYPVLLVVALALGGLFAFALTGFFGYRDEPAALVALFREPWPLFLWFSALLLTLEASIFRHPALRLRLFAVLTATVISMAVLTAIYFYRSELVALVAQIIEKPRQQLALGVTLDTVLGSPWTYTILNVLILGIFWADTVRRWLRRAAGQAPNPRTAALAMGEGNEGRTLPRMEDLLSGDLMAGAGLMLVLSVAFVPGVVSLVAQLAQSHATITQCTVSLPGTCAAPLTLAFIDLVAGLIALSLGLLVLAFSATLSGLGAVGGVDENEVEDPRLLVTDESSAESVSEQVGLTVVNTLRTALDRRVRLALTNLAFSLRAVAWPFLVFGAVVGLAFAARALQSYLHSDKALAAVFFDLLPAVGWGIVAVALALAAIGLLTFSTRAIANVLRFLGLVGLVVLLTFWILSLALWSINQLVVWLGLTPHTPFVQLGASTILSVIALIGYGSLAMRAASSRQGRQQGEPSQVGVAGD